MAFFASLLLYTLTLAPTVTLEFSGSMITAADHLGVPNPPGYPVWTLLAWLFQCAFGFVTYHGHPNPAWGVTVGFNPSPENMRQFGSIAEGATGDSPP